jgi:hypothetical protein
MGVGTKMVAIQVSENPFSRTIFRARMKTVFKGKRQILGKIVY